MMFGEQHLMRFGSMSKPAGTDALADPDTNPQGVEGGPADPLQVSSLALLCLTRFTTCQDSCTIADMNSGIGISMTYVAEPA